MNKRKRFLSYVVLAGIAVLSMVALAYAASGGGGESHDAELKNFKWGTVNFVVLLGFLYWLLAAKIKDFFAGRRANIKAEAEAAAAAKKEAQKKYDEYDAKLEKATDEITGIAESIKAQGLAEKERIIEDAKKAAIKIKEDAQARMDQEFKKASNELRLEVARLSVQMAEDVLKRNISAADHENMVRDYLDKVVTKH
jgi:F-type H+-transporting ATPase subunit b